MFVESCASPFPWLVYQQAAKGECPLDTRNYLAIIANLEVRTASTIDEYQKCTLRRLRFVLRRGEGSASHLLLPSALCLDAEIVLRSLPLADNYFTSSVCEHCPRVPSAALRDQINNRLFSTAAQHRRQECIADACTNGTFRFFVSRNWIPATRWSNKMRFA